MSRQLVLRQLPAGLIVFFLVKVIGQRKWYVAVSSCCCARQVHATFKVISFWRDRGAFATLCFQCAVYKLIYLLTYLLRAPPSHLPPPLPVQQPPHSATFPPGLGRTLDPSKNCLVQAPSSRTLDRNINYDTVFVCRQFYSSHILWFVSYSNFERQQSHTRQAYILWRDYFRQVSVTVRLIIYSKVYKLNNNRHVHTF